MKPKYNLGVVALYGYWYNQGRWICGSEAPTDDRGHVWFMDSSKME
jgi:hypothetical protein